MYQKKKKLKINIRMNNLRQYNLNTNVTLLNSQETFDKIYS